jgi:hypothetical protein
MSEPVVVTSDRSVRRGARVVFQAVFDLSRTRQALLSVAQPALGAVLALGALPSAEKMLLSARRQHRLAVFAQRRA